MNELRKDYFIDHWVIIAEDRGKRPTDFVCTCVEVEPKTCYFCPGNEHMTPPEICRLEEEGEWLIRCFPNKFPATAQEYKDSEGDLLQKMPAYGKHELIVETPKHGEHLGNLPVEHLVKVFDMYSLRAEELKKDPKIRYVMVFKNQGDAAGASLDHSHTQLIALPVIPERVREEIEAATKYEEEEGRCPFCDIWRVEKETERLICEDEHTIAYAPFASRFPFEARIMPKRHVKTWEEMTEDEKKSFAEILKKILTRLNTSLNNPPYNFWLHHSAVGCDLHLHLELAPRLAKFAGMELGSDIVINVVSPEAAASHYRGE